jgi:V/A-type H+-transporting ATPase subunit D
MCWPPITSLKMKRPTKTELMKLQKKKILAEKGMEVLNGKKIFLERELLVANRKFAEGNDQFVKTLGEIEATITSAGRQSLLMSTQEALSLLPADAVLLPRREKLFGKLLTQFTLKPNEKPKTVWGYSSLIVKAQEKMLSEAAVLEGLVNLEYRRRFIVKELESTNRKINALQKSVIPHFTSEIKYVQDFLEEDELEELGRIKYVKEHVIEPDLSL